MLNQIKIECFLTLARTLNFPAASRKLYITQQAVSSNISALEKEMGVLLFTRSSRSVALTAEGVRCLEMFQQMTELYDATLKELREKRLQDRSILHLGYQEWLDFGAEPNQAMTALQREHPSFRLSGERFPPSILRDRIISGQLDLALMYKNFFESLRVPGKTLYSLDLMETPVVIVVAANHPKAVPGATYRDFIREPFLFDVWSNEEVAESNKRVRAIIAQCGLEPERIIFVPNRDSGYTAAELGEGVIASSALNRIADRRTLKKYPVEGSYETVVCVWRGDTTNPLVEQYVKQLQQEYRHRRRGRRSAKTEGSTQ